MLLFGLLSAVGSRPAYADATVATWTDLTNAFANQASGSVISLSGNIGRQWVQDLNNSGTGYPYTHWDLGATATWNNISLDIRYIDTNISKSTCEGFNGPKNNWCGPTVVGTITYNFTIFGG